MRHRQQSFHSLHEDPSDSVLRDVWMWGGTCCYESLGSLRLDQVLGLGVYARYTLVCELKCSHCRYEIVYKGGVGVSASITQLSFEPSRLSTQPAIDVIAFQHTHAHTHTHLPFSKQNIRCANPCVPPWNTLKHHPSHSITKSCLLLIPQPKPTYRS